MYEFHESDAGGVVRTGDLATKLGVSPASATEMVQRLATRYPEYIPYKGARLTPQGLVHGQKRTSPSAGRSSARSPSPTMVTHTKRHADWNMPSTMTWRWPSPV